MIAPAPIGGSSRRLDDGTLIRFHVPLPPIPADRSIVRTMPRAAIPAFDRLLPYWIDTPDWAERIALWEALADTALEHPQPHKALIANLLYMTAALEHVGGHLIRCMDAAALYCLSVHPEWRQAGSLYFRGTSPEDMDAWLDVRRSLFAGMQAVAPIYGIDLDRELAS